jgi:hypothetical protein
VDVVLLVGHPPSELVPVMRSSAQAVLAVVDIGGQIEIYIETAVIHKSPNGVEFDTHATFHRSYVST